MALTDNPMSIIVTGNVTIGASLEASIPMVRGFKKGIVDGKNTNNGTIFLVPHISGCSCCNGW